jgi:hypothetical protein
MSDALIPNTVADLGRVTRVSWFKLEKVGGLS